MRLSFFALDEEEYNEQYRMLVAQAASKKAKQRSLDRLTPEQQARVAQMDKRIESRRRALMEDVDAILPEPQPFTYNPRLREIYPELPEYFDKKVNIYDYTTDVAATGIHYVQKQNPTEFGRVLQTYYSEKTESTDPHKLRQAGLNKTRK